MGIVAIRIAQKYHKTCIAGSLVNGIIKASGRSYGGFPLSSIIHEAKKKKIIINGGGHKEAVGLSLDINNKNEFCDLLYSSNYVCSVENFFDIDLPLSAVNTKTIDTLDQLEPFGNGFPQPLFLFKNIHILDFRVHQDDHVFLFLQDDAFSTCRASFFYMPVVYRDKCSIYMKERRKIHVIGVISRYKKKASIIVSDMIF